MVAATRVDRLGIRRKRQRVHRRLARLPPLHHLPLRLDVVHARVGAAHGQVVPAVVKPDAPHARRLEALEVLQLPEVPELHAVLGARRQVVPILGERHGAHGTDVALHLGGHLGGLDVPDLDARVRRAGAEDQAVGVETAARVLGAVGVARDAEALRLGDVHERPRAVAADGHRVRVRGVRGDGGDLALVDASHGSLLGSIGPNLNRLING